MSRIMDAVDYINRNATQTEGLICADIAAGINYDPNCLSVALNFAANKGLVRRARESAPHRGINKVQWMYYPQPQPTPAPQPAPRNKHHSHYCEQPTPTPPMAAPPQPTQTPIQAAIESLAAALADDIFAQLTARLDAKVETLRSGPTPSGLPREQEKARERKPRVAVIGLLPPQQSTVAEAFGTAFDLSFPDRESTQAIKSCHADKAFLMTKFISHWVVRCLESVKVDYSLVNGGVSDLLRVLRGYAEETK